MAIILHTKGYEYAKQLIKQGLEINHDISHWNEVKPTKNEVDRFVQTHSIEEYGLWFLGIDDTKPVNDLDRFVLPHGDLKIVHESAIIAAHSQATEKHLPEIKKATHDLIELLNQ